MSSEDYFNEVLGLLDIAPEKANFDYDFESTGESIVIAGENKLVFSEGSREFVDSNKFEIRNSGSDEYSDILEHVESFVQEQCQEDSKIDFSNNIDPIRSDTEADGKYGFYYDIHYGTYSSGSGSCPYYGTYSDSSPDNYLQYGFSRQDFREFIVNTYLKSTPNKEKASIQRQHRCRAFKIYHSRKLAGELFSKIGYVYYVEDLRKLYGRKYRPVIEKLQKYIAWINDQSRNETFNKVVFIPVTDNIISSEILNRPVCDLEDFDGNSDKLEKYNSTTRNLIKHDIKKMIEVGLLELLVHGNRCVSNIYAFNIKKAKEILRLSWYIVKDFDDIEAAEELKKISEFVERFSIDGSYIDPIRSDTEADGKYGFYYDIHYGTYSVLEAGHPYYGTFSDEDKNIRFYHSIPTSEKHPTSEMADSDIIAKLHIRYPGMKYYQQIVRENNAKYRELVPDEYYRSMLLSAYQPNIKRKVDTNNITKISIRNYSHFCTLEREEDPEFETRYSYLKKLFGTDNIFEHDISACIWNLTYYRNNQSFFDGDLYDEVTETNLRKEPDIIIDNESLKFRDIVKEVLMRYYFSHSGEDTLAKIKFDTPDDSKLKNELAVVISNWIAGRIKKDIGTTYSNEIYYDESNIALTITNYYLKKNILVANCFDGWYSNNEEFYRTWPEVFKKTVENYYGYSKS